MAMYDYIFRTMPNGEEFYKRVVEHEFELKKNVIQGIVGKHGSGKSFSACRYAQIIDPKFDPATHIIYHPLLFNEKIAEAIKNKYKVLILDEAHITIPARFWFSDTSKSINMVLNTFRQLHNLVLIFSTPRFTDLDKSVRCLFNFYCIAERYNKMNAYNYFYEVQYPFVDIINPEPKLKKCTFKIIHGKKYIIKKLKIGWIGDKMAEKYEAISKPFKSDLLKKQRELMFAKFSKKEKLLVEEAKKESEEIAQSF